MLDEREKNEESIRRDAKIERAKLDARIKLLETEKFDFLREIEHYRKRLLEATDSTAMDLLKKGMIFLPNSAELIYRLACYYYSIGNIQESYNVLASALDKNVQLCHTVFEYSPAMENDRHILEIIDLYKNRI